MMDGQRQRHRGQGLLQLYLNIPAVTRFYTTACLIVTLAANAEMINQYQLYLNVKLIRERYQFWRIFTCFLFAGPLRFGTAFHLLFSYRYSRLIEETYFQSRTSDYCFMYLFMSAMILVISAVFTNLLFLGQALTHAILYLWCRRNANTSVIIFGLVTIKANLVPFVLVGLSLLTGTSAAVDIVALFVGHCYYFLVDIFPYQRAGFKILKTPRFLKALFNELPLESTDPMHAVVDQNNNIVNN